MTIGARIVSGLLLCALLFGVEAGATEAIDGLEPVKITGDTSEKPQSKVWKHADTWWAVLPIETPAGTWLLRLEADGSWTEILELSTETETNADVKAVGDLAHVLIFDGTPELLTVEYVAATNTYRHLGGGSPQPAPITLGGNPDTATIDVDSEGVLWLATDTDGDIRVYRSVESSPPYTWSAQHFVLATGVGPNDLAVVTALPNGSVGVLWSNQVEKDFGFRVHEPGDDIDDWSTDEVPASQSNPDDRPMADDHLNVAVASDGTLYAAVKTSYDTEEDPTIALLVRRPDAVGFGGSWDDLYGVETNTSSTRGIVILEEGAGLVRVAYTDGGIIVYKDSPTDAIEFGPAKALMSSGFDDVTAAKHVWRNDMVLLATGGGAAHGRLVTLDTGLVGAIGYWKMDEDGGNELIDASGNFDPTPILSGLDDPSWIGSPSCLGLELDGADDHVLVPDDPKLDVTGPLTLAAWVQPLATGDQAVLKRAVTGGAGATDGYELSLDAAGKAFFRLNQASSGDTYRVESTGQYPTDGTWIHLAGTFEVNDDETRIMRLYVDGEEKGSAPGPMSIGSNGEALGIGAQSDGASRLHGGLDEVRVYARALGAAEIAALADVEPASAASLVAHYKMNEGMDFELVNETGPDLDATILDDAPTSPDPNPAWSPGIENLALELAGDKTHGSVDDHPALDIGSSITIAGWLLPSAVGTQRIVRKIDNDGGYSLFLSSKNGQLSFKLNNNDNLRLNSNYVYSEHLGEWVHVAAVYDGEHMRLFINGTQDNSRYIPGLTIVPNNNALTIGANGGGGNPLNGKLDEVRIYDGALTPPEIALLAAAPAGFEELWVVDVGGKPVALQECAAVDVSNPVGLGVQATNPGELGFDIFGVGVPISYVWDFGGTVSVPLLAFSPEPAVNYTELGLKKGTMSLVHQSGLVSERSFALNVVPPDFDGDGREDALDNCVKRANPMQRDTDTDGYGNMCDMDINHPNDGVVDNADALVLACVAQGGGVNCDADDADHADFNGDGDVDVQDFWFFFGPNGYGKPLGPSGYACAGQPPCPGP